MRFIFDNVADVATLTSPDFVSTMPVTNLQLEGRAKTARTTNATGTKIVYGTWASVKSVSAFCLYRHNLTTDATFRLRLWSGANQSGDILYDSGTLTIGQIIPWGYFPWGDPWAAFDQQGWESPFRAIYFTSVAALSFQLDFTDGGNPDGYLDAKRIVLGPYLDTINPAVGGLSVEWVDPSLQRRTRAGSIRSESEAMWRRYTLTFDSLPESDRAALLDAARQAGKKFEVFLSVFPEADELSLVRDYSMLAKITAMPIQTSVEYKRARQTMVFEEV